MGVWTIFQVLVFWCGGSGSRVNFTWLSALVAATLEVRAFSLMNRRPRVPTGVVVIPWCGSCRLLIAPRLGDRSSIECEWSLDPDRNDSRAQLACGDVFVWVKGVLNHLLHMWTPLFHHIHMINYRDLGEDWCLVIAGWLLCSDGRARWSLQRSCKILSSDRFLDGALEQDSHSVSLKLAVKESRIGDKLDILSAQSLSVRGFPECTTRLRLAWRMLYGKNYQTRNHDPKIWKSYLLCCVFSLYQIQSIILMTN